MTFDTMPSGWRGVERRPRPRRRGFPLMLLESFVIRTPHLLTLTLAVATALSGCKKSEDAAPAAPA
ncbi:hypothetical protein, partial [Xanthomonas phaseoli]|uniref:hypothetical protein n=1 Tax=Xanthomonas phaseoli TaxID=1985254 RepID=UPI001266F99E